MGGGWCHACQKRRSLDIAGYCMGCAEARRATCSHPPTRYYAWYARDDREVGGTVLCIACCDCGAVVKGAA